MEGRGSTGPAPRAGRPTGRDGIDVGGIGFAFAVLFPSFAHGGLWCRLRRRLLPASRNYTVVVGIGAFAVLFPGFELGDLWRWLGRRLLSASRDHIGVVGIGAAFAVLFPGFERGGLWCGI